MPSEHTPQLVVNKFPATHALAKRLSEKEVSIRKTVTVSAHYKQHHCSFEMQPPDQTLQFTIHSITTVAEKRTKQCR